MAAAITAKAANGVAQASAKLARQLAAVSNPKQNSGAWRASTGASRGATISRVNDMMISSGQTLFVSPAPAQRLASIHQAPASHQARAHRSRFSLRKRTLLPS